MNHIELLNKLLNFEEPIDLIAMQLEKFGWDFPNDLIMISKVHLIKALNKYLGDQLNEFEIENWANAIESREDIGFEITSEDLIRGIMHELANPYLTENLTKERAKTLLNKLTK